MITSLLTILLLTFLDVSAEEPEHSTDVYAEEPEHSTDRLTRALNTNCELRKLYNEYKELHQHVRPNHEEQDRLNIFIQEIKEIVKLRANKEIKWEVGINFMADMTDSERGLMTGYNQNSSSNNVLQANVVKFENKLSQSKSASSGFDEWRQKGYMGPVPDQIKSNCWAIAAVAPIEAQLAQYEKKFRRLSIQELYDCTYSPAHPIDDLGGNPLDAWRYIAIVGRLGTWKEHPEIKSITRQSCKGRYSPTKNALADYDLKSVYQIKAEKDLIELLTTTSPIVVGLDTIKSDIRKYKKGAFNPLSCNPLGDHTMVIVGYTTETFIIRNSWGKKWGDKGYVMWDRKGLPCGMYVDAYSASLDEKSEEIEHGLMLNPKD